MFRIFIFYLVSSVFICLYGKIRDIASKMGNTVFRAKNIPPKRCVWPVPSSTNQNRVEVSFCDACSTSDSDTDSDPFLDTGLGYCSF